MEAKKQHRDLPRPYRILAEADARLRMATYKNEWSFEPLTDGELTYFVSVGRSTKIEYQRKCQECLEPAEHKLVQTLDPTYRRYYCTACRDKENESK